MLEEFKGLELFPVTFFDILGNLTIALICGLIISVIYRIVYKGPSYSVTFVHSLVLLSMITALVILVIGNNLARAFGLVGAMSIIRFRTAVRDVQDIIFIFFSLTVGMAAGVGLTVIAIAGTLFVSAVIYVMSITNFASTKRRLYLLQIAYKTEADEAKLNTTIKKYCRELKLVNLKTMSFKDEIEAYYQIKLKNKDKINEMVNSVSALTGVANVNIFFDEDDVNPPTM